MSRGGHGPWASRAPTEADRRSFADASTTPFWLDSPGRPAARPPLDGDSRAELAIVGGGLSGLWAAVLALERDPDADVVVLDSDRIGWAASGRNGGFLSSFLTHGIGNGMARFPEEMATLERLGLENFAATGEALERLGIDCDLTTGGDLDVAIEPHELGWLEEEAAALRRFGHDVELLDREAIRAQIDSPLFIGGVWRRSGGALVDPGKLCWGLAAAVERLGGRIHEATAVRSLGGRGDGVALRTGGGELVADRALLATSAFPGLLGAIRRRVVPVWDYVLVTEPLTAAQRNAIGWANAQGLGDLANRFHYSRPTADGRILWGGYDAIYHFANGIGPDLAQREESFADLASTSSPRSRSSRGSGSATAGAARSTRAAGSSPFRAPRSMAASPTRSGTPGSASGRAGSAPAWRSTCSTGAPPRRPRSPRCGRSRCRFRPSPCAGRRSS